MRIAWGAVAIGAAVAASVVGAVIAFQPDTVSDDPEYYRFELTREGPLSSSTPYRWLVTVEGDRVTSAILQEPPPDFDPIGYALPTLDDLLAASARDDNYEVAYKDEIPASFCYNHPGDPGWTQCDRITKVTPITADAAREARTWEEPTSYSVTVRTESVTWDLWSTWRADIENGAVTDTSLLDESSPPGRVEPPTEGVGAMVDRDLTTDPFWTVYWRAGEPNPAAQCFDDPNVFDEETCYYFSDYEIKP